MTTPNNSNLRDEIGDSVPNPNTESDWIEEALDWQTNAVLEVVMAEVVHGTIIKIDEKLARKHRAQACTLILQKLVEARYDEVERLSERAIVTIYRHRAVGKHDTIEVGEQTGAVPGIYVHDRLAELSTLKKELKK